MLHKSEGDFFMNLKQADYIRAIAQEGSITAAAKKLFISQPSLSQALRQAETELGVPIFYRKTTPLRLTYAGERYLQTAELIRAAVDRLDGQVRQIKMENSGRLRVGISIQRATQILPFAFPLFRARYPNVALELVEEGSARLEELVMQGQVDLAMAAVEATSPQLTYQLIETEVIGVVAGKGSHLCELYPSGTSINLRASAQDSFIATKPGHSIRVVQDKLFRRSGMRPEILLETESIEIAKRIALEAGACMLCSNIYVDDTVREKGGFYPLEDYENHRHFYACYHKDDYLLKYALDLIEIFRTVLSERGNSEFAGKTRG